MGYQINWIAVKGDTAAALAALELEDGGEASHPMLASYCCARLPGGWLVVTSTDRKFSVERSLSSVAAPGLAVGAEMSEVVMVSRAVGSVDGHKAWSVGHDPEQGIEDVQVDGDPPEALSGIVQALQLEQQSDESDSVDYMFDAPIALVAQVCGFRPDKDSTIEWRALRSVAGRSAAVPEEPIPNVRASLAPLMASLGWAATSTRPDLFAPAASHEFFRVLDNLQHVMWFDFGWQASSEGDQPFFTVGFLVQEPALADRTPSGPLLRGYAEQLEARPPFWKRVFSPRTPRPSRAQQMAKILDGVRGDIRAVDEFLRTGARAPNVHVGGGSAKETWPSLPPRQQ